MKRQLLALLHPLAISRPRAASALSFRSILNPCLLAWLLVTLSAAAIQAQTANQITQQVDAMRSRPLASHLPQWANAANETGALPSDRNFEHLTLVLARSPQQQQAFESFLASQQDPASPDYHHWLTPSEVGDRFGLSDQDIASITAWLQSQGLHLNWVAPSRIFIGFGGRAAELGQALHTELHSYQVSGTERFSVSSDPLIPEALAPAIKAIHGLYTLEEQPQFRAEAMQSDSPLMNGSSGNHYLAPADFATIYDVPGGSNGYGQTIGILGRSRTNFADFAAFRQRTGSNFLNPTEIVPTAFGGVDPGPAYTSPPNPTSLAGEQGEATLDVTRAGSVASSANLLLVVAGIKGGGIEAGAQYLVQTSPVPVQVMTISYGGCESSAGLSDVAFWDTLFQQAAAEGISSFVSSGDSGASGCDANFQTPPVAPVPNSPNYICSSSYVTCVGGTEFNDAGNPSAYWSSGNGYGLSSAYGYIPEGAWNEPLNSKSAPQTAATGGGVSSIIPTPAWQTGTGVPAARSGRYTPDISFSGSIHDGYFGCFAAGNGSCVSGSNGSYQFLSFAGTSASAPSMAGIAAILDARKGEPQGNLNPGLYKLAANVPAAFHDVTVATSGVGSCTVNTPSLCNNSIPSANGLSGGQAGYAVTTGYDEATGLGSLDVQSFLSSFAAKLVPTVTVTPSPASITVLQPLTVAVTVSGGNGNPMPTGTVQLTSGSYSSAVVTLNNGAASFNIPAGKLAGGAGAFLTVAYTPDAASSPVYSAASGSTWVAVSLVLPTVTVTPSPDPATTAQALNVSVTVDGGSGAPAPTGSVSLSAGGYSSSAQLNNGSATFNILAGLLPPGAYPLLVTYSPDTAGNVTYSSASGSATLSVNGTAPITPQVTITQPGSPGSSLNNTQSLPFAVTVSAGNGSSKPTGTVVLTSGSYSSVPVLLVGGTASITIPAGALQVGFDSLIAIYAPDSASSAAYNNASGTLAVTIIQTAVVTPSVQVTPVPLSITADLPLPVTVAVGSGSTSTIDCAMSVITITGGPECNASGTVTLTSGGYTSPPATLSSGSTTINIPGSTLPAGTDTLTATYTPDGSSLWDFTTASGAAIVTVSPAPPPSFVISGGSSVTLQAGATSGNSAQITLVPSGGFTGSVALTASITNAPGGAHDPPTLSFGSTSPVNVTVPAGASALLTITTTAPTSAALIHPRRPGLPWYAAGGASLACLLLIGIPKRRRLRSILGASAFLIAFAGILSCGGAISGGGGGGGGNSGGNSSSGTTPGIYTITVTGTSGTIVASGTLTLNVE